MEMNKKRRYFNNEEWTPLHFIVMKNSWPEIGELLLSKGADINMKDLNYYIVISLFLQKIFDIKLWILNLKKKTPLDIAIKYNSNKIVEFLLSKGADLNLKDINLRNLKYYF